MIHKSNKIGQASLSESAWKALKAKDGDVIEFGHLQPVDSIKYGRKCLTNH